MSIDSKQWKKLVSKSTTQTFQNLEMSFYATKEINKCCIVKDIFGKYDTVMIHQGISLSVKIIRLKETKKVPLHKQKDNVSPVTVTLIREDFKSLTLQS